MGNASLFQKLDCESRVMVPHPVTAFAAYKVCPVQLVSRTGRFFFGHLPRPYAENPEEPFRGVLCTQRTEAGQSEFSATRAENCFCREQ